MTGRESWRDAGRCAEVGDEIFFPDRGGDARPAKRVCAACEVREPCLEYALAMDERFGIWGGKSERERRRISAARERAARNGLAA